MESHKTKIILITLISIFCALFMYLIIFYGNEKIENPKKEFTFSKQDATQEKIEINRNSKILFETNDYIVYEKIKRNEQVFTQGLFFDTANTLIESGGLYGQSVLQKFKINTPDEKYFKIPIERKYFAEGACLFKNKVYQLTWRERVM
jgi:glutamine cyclotransferase